MDSNPASFQTLRTQDVISCASREYSVAVAEDLVAARSHEGRVSGRDGFLRVESNADDDEMVAVPWLHARDTVVDALIAYEVAARGHRSLCATGATLASWAM